MSVITSICSEIAKKGNGRIFLLKDFAHMGTENAVKKALSRLCNTGAITRLGKGIYCSLEEDQVFGFGKKYPSRDSIAQAVADSEGITIIPTVDFAMNALNLSTQIQTNSVFLTDGCKRKIHLDGYKGAGITFVHCSNRRLFQVKNKTMLLIILSMKGIGERNLDMAQMKIIKSQLGKITLQDYLHDIKLAPVWIQKKLQS